ncbi:MAG: hypothetical protein UV42_C0009G0014 [Candidatus Magasanikbacteria bacterium GW2011_GWE2_42_7]|uniref:Uncharacterized protein n=1 Tax=Candidatus Magasanikbacteria bacterium GW2011_GWE2_42_7 TaxID=1619052 RepID=A0A0G1BGG6_9BACT|nr:MAG: hypothetical protein UV42_C0009G0014 [Candidatus Magasanikbacteria bacterium GW2011_GWE2_42_7]
MVTGDTISGGRHHTEEHSFGEFDAHHSEEKDYRSEAIAKLKTVVRSEDPHRDDQVIMLIQMIAIEYLMTRYKKPEHFFFGEFSNRFRQQFIPSGGELSYIYDALMVQRDITNAVKFVEQKMDEWVAEDVVYGTSHQASA